MVSISSHITKRKEYVKLTSEESKSKSGKVMKTKRRSTSSTKDKEKGNNVRRKNNTRKNDGRTGTIFLTAI